MDDNKRSVDIDNNKDEERMENDFLDDEMMEAADDTGGKTAGGYRYSRTWCSILT